MRFKLRFLTIYSTKSRFQELRGCGNGRGTRWNREKREGRCIDSSNRLNSNSDAYKCRRTSCFIGHLGVTVRSKRSTVTMERSIVDRSLKSWPSDLDQRSGCAAWISVIKTLRFRSLDRNPTVWISPARSNRSRYNAILKARAF